MAITFGDTSNPSQISTYLDALFAQTLGNYSKTIVDNIGKSNKFFHKLIKSGLYEGEDSGTHIQVPLMTAINTIDSYSGYDELSVAPIDGVTSAVYEWSQLATPIAYAMSDVLKNRSEARLVNLVKTKIQQAEIGIQEGFMDHFLQGSGNGARSDP